MNEIQIIEELKKYSNDEYARHHSRFFKTAHGEYGEGDLFYGLKMPQIHLVVKNNYKNLSLNVVESLLQNPYHEVRMCALLILVKKFEKSKEDQSTITQIYLNNIKYINNWDLVDLSAPHILGFFWFKKDLDELWQLAKSNHLWSERISILTTLGFIRKGENLPTLELCEFFLNHKHDLIHKATGWMLREIGKREIGHLYSFLDQHHKIMPRTMLRYSIEKLSTEKRAFYLQKSKV